MIPDIKFMTIRELASEGPLTEYAIRKYVSEGKIPNIKCGNRVMIEKNMFLKWLSDSMDKERLVEDYDHK